MNARSPRWMALAVAGALLSGCGYNKLQRQDENVKAAWSEVVNQYQRRAELVPNLVKTVAGFAQQQVLNGVTRARATVSSMPASADVLNNPEAFARYQAAQNQLSQSLENLLAVSDGYPQLKSNESFRDLRMQLQKRESGIALARARYIEAVRQYNSNVGTFPASLTAQMLDFHRRPTLTAAEGETRPTPSVVGNSRSVRPTGGQIGVTTKPMANPAQSESEPAGHAPRPSPHHLNEAGARTMLQQTARRRVLHARFSRRRAISGTAACPALPGTAPRYGRFPSARPALQGMAAQRVANLAVGTMSYILGL